MLGLLLAAPADSALPRPADSAMAVPDGPADKDGDQILTRYLQVSRKGILRGASMMAHFAGRLPKMQKTATLDAQRRISKEGTLEYLPTDRQGDNTVQKELIIRFMTGEMESFGKDNSKVAINADNYRFKYKGQRDREGRTVHIFELNPKKKREGLFKGELWLDADTGLSVREAGRFVKSPSVFLKKVEFTREYTIRDGLAVPKTMQSSIETRFWGNAELDIQYSDVVIEAPLLAN